jgi:SNF2 family DNA or RNA helicase
VTGVDKLIWLAKSPFKGGFLCNAMGLGESTQALVAAIQVKRTMPTRSGFIAIVTRAVCVLQWADEIKRHLKPVSKFLYLSHTVTYFINRNTTPYTASLMMILVSIKTVACNITLSFLLATSAWQNTRI